MSKRKRMTQREKDLRARTKKELQAQGVLPPDKPRLNRKKFAREAWSEFQALLGGTPSGRNMYCCVPLGS